MKKNTIRPVALAAALLFLPLSSALAAGAKTVLAVKSQFSISKIIPRSASAKTIYLADGGPSSKPCPGCRQIL